MLLFTAPQLLAMVQRGETSGHWTRLDCTPLRPLAKVPQAADGPHWINMAPAAGGFLDVKNIWKVTSYKVSWHKISPNATIQNPDLRVLASSIEGAIYFLDCIL